MNKQPERSHLSVRTKLMMLCYGIAFLLSLVFGLFLYYTSRSYVLEKVNESNVSIVSQIASNLDYMRTDLFNISTLICVNPDFQQYMRGKSAGAILPDDFINYINAGKSEISLMIIYNDAGIPVYYRSSDMSTGILPLDTQAQRDVYEAAKAGDGGPLWMRLNQGSTLFVHSNTHEKLVLYRLIKDLYTMRPLGMMVLCVNTHTIQQQFIGARGEGEAVLVTGNGGEPLIFCGTPYDGYRAEDVAALIQPGRDYFTYRAGNRDLFTTYAKSKQDGWRYFYSIPASNLSYPLQDSAWYALGLILCSLACTYLLAHVAVSRLTRPLMVLTQSMGRFQRGSFEEQVAVVSRDEIGKLQEGYNHMVREIKGLIEDVYVLQIREREAELKALQAEINPHFLYNTLDMVYWKAEAQKATEISEIIYSISRMFRLTLNIGKSFTTVAAEKELITHYLNLQKTRFQDKFTYGIAIPEEMLHEKLPKLLLQPFVENSIIHGIEPLDSQGLVTVSGWMEEDRLCFEIADNGVGFSAGPQDALPSGEPQQSPSSGYAIPSIYERLRLHYGERYRLEIASAPGQGTKVILQVPRTGREE